MLSVAVPQDSQGSPETIPVRPHPGKPQLGHAVAILRANRKASFRMEAIRVGFK